MSKCLGEITKEEANEIKRLFSRKQALEELLPTIDLSKDDALYQRIIEDLVTTKIHIGTWWKTISSKYQWDFTATDSWWLDYETRIICLR